MKYRFTDAKATCDRCGIWNFKHSELRNQVIAGSFSGLMVCPRCYDEDHPQQFVGRYTKPERVSVRNPRPDTGSTRGGVGYNPVPSYTLIVGQGKVWAV